MFIDLHSTLIKYKVPVYACKLSTKKIYIPLWLNIKSSHTIDPYVALYEFTFHSD